MKVSAFALSVAMLALWAEVGSVAAAAHTKTFEHVVAYFVKAPVKQNAKIYADERDQLLQQYAKKFPGSIHTGGFFPVELPKEAQVLPVANATFAHVGAHLAFPSLAAAKHFVEWTHNQKAFIEAQKLVASLVRVYGYDQLDI